MDLRDEHWLDWLSEVDPFSAGYLGCRSPHHGIRLAHALRNAWASEKPRIETGDQIVGRRALRGIGGFTFGSGICCDRGLAEQLRRENLRWAEHLDALVDFWNGWTPQSRVRLPEDERWISGQNVYWAGWGGHTVLGFDKLLAGGLEAIRHMLEDHQSGEGNPEKRAFREALLVVCDGIEAFASNYAKAAAEMAAHEWNATRREQLAQISERCAQVPRLGARSFLEALQSFWFIHLLDGCDSPGRFDQFMWPYYERDVAQGRLDASEAQAWLDHLWQRFNDTRSWNLCVGGLRPDGSDGTNELTYMALEATRRTQKVAPNLSLRLHRQSSELLWQKAIQVLETGVGMPALYNDDLLVPALMRYGIPESEARDYAMNGCSQIDIQGRSHMGLEDGELNLLKCLEVALHNGQDPHTGRQIGPATGDPCEFAQFEDLWDAYRTQVEFFTRRLIEAANAVQQAHAETSPNLLRSLFVKDCIAEERDFKAGGPRYNHGQILTQGIANTGDSLMVIRELVFERGEISMRELIDALNADFPDEAFRQRLIHEVPKFGNDEPGVDALTARVIAHFYEHLNSYRTWRGGVYGGGSIVFVRGISFGQKVGATPDGRKAGTPLADSVGPTQGRDTHGPTAMLNSVSRVPQHLAQSTYVLNIKFTPRLVRENRDALVVLFQTYFGGGGQQIQVNVLDAETLRRACQQPDDYGHLIVRVGGYSDYFVRLSPELQQDVITRTEQDL